MVEARNRKDKPAITAYLLIGGKPLSIHKRLREKGKGRKGEQVVVVVVAAVYLQQCDNEAIRPYEEKNFIGA